MKVVQVNVNCGGGSVGKICVSVSKLLTERGIENYILYALGKSEYPLGIKYTTKATVKLETLLSKVTGRFGFSAYLSTRRLLKQLEKINPDIIQLHNIHNNNVHLGMLFDYIKKKHIKTFWTFHDCFAFTGYCMYFDMCNCDKWKERCSKCPQYKLYSFMFDRSRNLFQLKEKAYLESDLTIITPSKWMANLVKESMLRNNKVEVIHNGIDLSIFHPIDSSLREKYKANNRFIILSVAYNWETRKGLDVFIRLARDLDDRYQIILVGTNDEVDKKLPPNIISVHKTSNQKELVELYTVADVFAIPTREDNYPTVNMESIACGTPVVTYDTGGSPEMVDKKTGVVVPKENYEMFLNAIIEICEKKKFKKEDCVKKAQNEFWDINCFSKYVTLYTNSNLGGVE
jgi:glycosyltransferase involved in cell wall biosynthesis